MLPGFTADQSLGPTVQTYRVTNRYTSAAAADVLAPQYVEDEPDMEDMAVADDDDLDDMSGGDDISDVSDEL